MKLNFIYEHFKGDVLDGFIQIIPNFYSSKANVEFTIVCFDGVDVISSSGSKLGVVLVYRFNGLEEIINGRRHPCDLLKVLLFA